MLDARTYGAVFRELREMKNLSLSKACAGICSKAQLSRFENGENDLGTSKLFALLEHIGVTAEEYVIQLRGFKPDPTNNFFDEISDAEEEHNFQKVIKIYEYEKQCKGERHQINALVARQFLAIYQVADYIELSEDEKRQIADYLFAILEWGYYETKLYFVGTMILAYPLVLEFGQELLKRTIFYRNVAANRKLVSEALGNLAFRALYEQDFESAHFFINQSNHLIGNHDWSFVVAPKLFDYELLRVQGDFAGAEVFLQKLIEAYQVLGKNELTLKSLEEELKSLQKNPQIPDMVKFFADQHKKS